MQVDLDAEARNELGAMAYNRWAIAYDKHKEAMRLTYGEMSKACPKADWPSLHALIVETAQKELDTANRVREAIYKFSPIVLGS